MNKRHIPLLGLVLLLLATATAATEERMLMARVQLDFPEAMSLLQQTITTQGYTVSRVQHVDVGLSASGFETDRYRIVFYGKGEEVRRLSRQYPQLIPYLPLMMTIFSEGEETLVIASDPTILNAIAADPQLETQLQRWQQDIVEILDTLRAN